MTYLKENITEDGATGNKFIRILAMTSDKKVRNRYVSKFGKNGKFDAYDGMPEGVKFLERFVDGASYDQLQSELNVVRRDQEIKFNLIMEHGQTIQKLREEVELARKERDDNRQQARLSLKENTQLQSELKAAREENAELKQKLDKARGASESVHKSAPEDGPLYHSVCFPFKVIVQIRQTLKEISGDKE